MKDFDTDVIIAGAGPTGLMLAGELRLAGIETIVVDRLTQPIQQSRALGFSARAIEEFSQRGLLPHFGDLQVIPFGHFGGLPIDFRVVAGGSYGARGKPQSLTEAVLARWGAGLGSVVHRGYEVTGLAQDEEGAEVEVATPEGRQRIRARYVAGCDGGKSIVRKLSGVEFPGTDPVIEMWFADVAGCQLRPRYTGERVPGGYVMVLPLGPDVNRVVVFLHEGMQRDGDNAPSFADIAGAWQRLTGEDISAGTPLWTSWTSDSSRQAAEYRRGRVFLLGDAAHIHLPIGAQGMSSGIGDAMNLGWKLAATLKGYAPEGLLDTYHSERHPVAERVLTNTLAQRILYLSGDQMDPMREVMAELLEYPQVQHHLVGMVTGLDIRYDMGEGGHPLLGRRLPDTELTGSFGQADTATAYEFLHTAHGVIFDLAGRGELRDAAAPWSDRVDVVTAGSRPAGVLEDIDAVLVRPDGYIAWIASAGSGAEGLIEALSRWFGGPIDAHDVAEPAYAGARLR